MHSSNYEKPLQSSPGANKSCDYFIIFIFIHVRIFMSTTFVFSRRGFIFTAACEVQLPAVKVKDTVLLINVLTR